MLPMKGMTMSDDNVVKTQYQTMVPASRARMRATPFKMFVGRSSTSCMVGPEDGSEQNDRVMASQPADSWPALPFAEWADTAATLHMWTQIVGKIRLALTPWTNHSWHVTLYLTSRGLTTSPIPHGTRIFEIRFDFIDHELRIRTSDGTQNDPQAATAQSSPIFIGEVMNALRELGIPGENQSRRLTRSTDPIPFDQDETHRAYDPEYANRFWRVLLQSRSRLQRISAALLRQMQPGPFFLGQLRSGRDAFFGTAGAAASRRNSAFAGRGHARSLFAGSEQPWILAGNAAMPTPIFYSYAYPEPPDFAEAKVQPDGRVLQHTTQGICAALRCGAQAASSPDRGVAQFAQSTYDAASTLGNGTAPR